jgi:DNA polymerase-3 subunit gamma/tau
VAGEEVDAVSLALYRKYRPTTFAELIGQEHVTEPLSQALRSGRLNHAYLFSGPRGCGKTSSARILARSLNCEQGPTPDPCGKCESCLALSNDGPGSIDVIEIDAASHGGVDDARDLRERAFYTPVAGRYKIYVIDEAHMVSSAGFNALLKLVEEPPEFVKFVFATTEPEKVLPTIKSRTHHYPFRLIPPGVLRPYLEQLCAAEGVAVEPAVFPLVVRAGGGSARDTLSVLDQLIAGAGAEGVTYGRAAALLGVTDAALIDELCDALVAGDGAAMFAAVDRVAEAGHDTRRFAADLLERLRDLIILQQVPEAAAKGLLDVPADQLERMSVHASQLGLATLSRCADIVHNGLIEMRGTASPRLLLELICARMLLPGAEDGDGALLHRLERMERRLGATGDAPASAPPASVPAAGAPPARPAAVPADLVVPDQPPADLVVPDQPPADPGPGEPTRATAGAAPVDTVAIRRVWEEVVATVGRRSKRAAAVVREASVRDVVGNTIVLQFQHSVHATMLAGTPGPLLAAVQEVLGGSWQIRCETREDPRRQPVEPAASSTGSAPAASGGEPDWPEPARPGGPAAAPAAPAGPAGPAGPVRSTAPAGPAGPAGPARSTAPAGPAAAGPGAVGAAAVGPVGSGAAGSRPVGSRQGGAGGAVADDGVDEVEDARADPLATGQQALELLQQTLGAERIGG